MQFDIIHLKERKLLHIEEIRESHNKQKVKKKEERNKEEKPHRIRDLFLTYSRPFEYSFAKFIHSHIDKYVSIKYE